MVQTRTQDPCSPVENLYSLGFKVVTRDLVPSGCILGKVITNLKKRAWLRRPTNRKNSAHHETFTVSAEGPQKMVCDFWCDEL